MAASMKGALVKGISRAIWPILRRNGESTDWQTRWQPQNHLDPIDLWIHCASLGEIVPYLDFLAKASNSLSIGVTITSGRSFSALLERLPPAIQCQILPLPHSPLANQLATTWKPKRFVTVEAEFWPHILEPALDNGAELVILDGRLNNATRRILKKIVSGHKHAIQHILTRDAQTAESFVDLGVDSAHLSYPFLPKLLTLKTHPPDERFTSLYPADSTNITVGSLHPEETKVIAKAALTLQQHDFNVRWIVAPRHPQRAEAIAKVFSKAGVGCATWPEQDVVTIVPMFGVLNALYAAADVTIVGGSWNGHGCHNLLEPLAHNKLVFCGPSTNNQRILFELVQKNVVVCKDGTELAEAILCSENAPTAFEASILGTLIDETKLLAERALLQW